MPPFRRPDLSHRLVLVALGGVAFRGPPDQSCRRKTSYTITMRVQRSNLQVFFPHGLGPYKNLLRPPR